MRRRSDHLTQRAVELARRRNTEKEVPFQIRPLQRDEIERLWEIDRAELIRGIYRVRDGSLVLEPEVHDIPGWPPGERDRYGPLLKECFDQGGIFEGAFEGPRIVAVMVLETRFIGPRRDRLQLKLLHVSRGSRDRGLGRTLFERAVEHARRAGATSLYVSATPSENTIRFYRKLGCVLADPVDPELHELEPDDIHLEYRI